MTTLRTTTRHGVGLLQLIGGMFVGSLILAITVPMYLAAQRGAEMPPISVYRFRDQHYVADGHHRVSVARALGAEHIEAHVVELT